MIFLGSLLVLTLVVIFGREFVKGKVNTSTSPTTQQSPKQSVEPPESVTYHIVFRHVVWLNHRADELERQGADGSAYKNRYQKFAGLTDHETSLLNQVATDTVNRVREYDAQIKVLVEADRAERKKQKLSTSSPPPPLNPEVMRVDQERRAAILAGYSRLKDSFEGSRFAKFEAFVKKQVASQIQPLTQKPASEFPAVPREAQSLKGGRTR
jgi:hypothetical protein